MLNQTKIIPYETSQNLPALINFGEGLIHSLFYLIQSRLVKIRIKGLRYHRFLSGFVSYLGFIKYRLGSKE